MRPPPRRQTLVAVDTNVLLHLAENLDDVWDALHLIQSRLDPVQIVVPPTTGQELAHLADNDPDLRLRTIATRTFQKMVSDWKFHLMDFVPVGHGIVEQIANKLRHERLILDDEINDSVILAEAALLGCHILLTNDAHLRGIDFQRLTLLLQEADVSVPIIATPREIVRKFS